MRPDDPRLGPTSIRVGCVNFEAVARAKSATLAKLLAGIATARERGCDLVIFPELALNSWGHCEDCATEHRPCSWHRAEAELADGPSCRAVIEADATHGIHVIYGFEEADAADDAVIYNSANVVSPHGLVGSPPRASTSRRRRWCARTRTLCSRRRPTASGAVTARPPGPAAA